MSERSLAYCCYFSDSHGEWVLLLCVCRHQRRRLLLWNNCLKFADRFGWTWMTELRQCHLLWDERERVKTLFVAAACILENARGPFLLCRQYTCSPKLQTDFLASKVDAAHMETLCGTWSTMGKKVWCAAKTRRFPPGLVTPMFQEGKIAIISACAKWAQSVRLTSV